MTDPLEAWKGDLGDEYTRRNDDIGSLPARRLMFEECLACAAPPDSILEFGANVGLNLIALRHLYPKAALYGIEPNKTAAKQLAGVVGYLPSDSSLSPYATFDLVFTCGVLIHIPPSDLVGVCQKLFQASQRYILICEYFSPEPEEKTYRGREGLLWTRDFGEYWLRNLAVRNIDYGFCWKPGTGLDNLTWWLFEK